MNPERMEKFRLGCYITWAVIEPLGLVIMVLFMIKIIHLLEELR